MHLFIKNVGKKSISRLQIASVEDIDPPLTNTLNNSILRGSIAAFKNVRLASINRAFQLKAGVY